MSEKENQHHVTERFANLITKSLRCILAEQASKVAYVFPTLDPTKPPMPTKSRMKSCNSLFSTHLKKTHPGNNGFGLIETEPFFNFLFSCTAAK